MSTPIPVMVVYGTRPEEIKVAPIIREVASAAAPAALFGIVERMEDFDPAVSPSLKAAT